MCCLLVRGLSGRRGWRRWYVLSSTEMELYFYETTVTRKVCGLVEVPTTSVPVRATAIGRLPVPGRVSGGDLSLFLNKPEFYV